MRHPWEWGAEHGPVIASRPAGPLLPFALVVRGEIFGVHFMCAAHGRAWAVLLAFLLSRGDPPGGLFLVARDDVVRMASDGTRRCFNCSRDRQRNRISHVWPPVLLSDLTFLSRDGTA